MQAGKSTLCRELSERHPWQPVSFGNLIREEAARRGVPSTRTHLQDLGEEYLRSIGAAALWTNARCAVAQRDIYIVDGVRHVDVLNAIRQDCERVLTVAVVADIHERYARYAKTTGRTAVGLEEFERWNRHAVEREISTLIADADVVVDAVSPTELQVKRVEAAWSHYLA